MGRSQASPRLLSEENLDRVHHGKAAGVREGRERQTDKGMKHEDGVGGSSG